MFLELRVHHYSDMFDFIGQHVKGFPIKCNSDGYGPLQMISSKDLLGDFPKNLP